MAPLIAELGIFSWEKGRRQVMQEPLFQLPLRMLLISRELRLRTSHLPTLKQLLQGTQLGLEVLVGPGGSEPTTDLSWLRPAVRVGVWWGKGP